MTSYSAMIVAVTPQDATVRLDGSGQEIRLLHEAHNRVPEPSRTVGATGYVSFPKAPPVFTPKKP